MCLSFPMPSPRDGLHRGMMFTHGAGPTFKGNCIIFAQEMSLFLFISCFSFFQLFWTFFFPLMTEESLISFDFSSFCCIFVGLTRRRGDVQLSLSHPLVGKEGLSSAFFPVLLSPREGQIAPLFLLFFFSIY